MFTGAWNNKSGNQWHNVSDDVKKEIKFNANQNDEFFMLFSEFLQSFDNLDFMHLNLNAFYSKNADYKEEEVNWKNRDFSGEWIAGKSAGGKLAHHSI